MRKLFLFIAMLISITSPVLFPVASFAGQRPAAANVTRTVIYKPFATASHAAIVGDTTVMAQRLKSVGIKHPNINVDGRTIHVALSGANNADVGALEQLLGVTGQLLFRPVLCGAPSFKTSAHASTTYKVPPTCPAPYRYSTTDFHATQELFSPPTKYDEDPSYANYVNTPAKQDNPTANVILPMGSSGGLAERYVLGPSKIDGKIVNGSIIKDAYSERTQTGTWIVVFNLTKAGSSTFNDIAKANYRQLLANDLDGSILAAPVIEARTFNGSGEIAGNFTKTSAGQVAAIFNSGPLPTRLQIEASAR